MSQLSQSSEALIREANKKKDGDQLFKPEENFKALMGDDEDTVAFVFQHVSARESILTSVAKTTRGVLSFGATVKGEIDHNSQESDEIATRKPFRHWKPSLVVEKAEVVCNEGDQAMLQVQINGYPKPDMRCTFQDIPIKPSSKYKIYHENHEHILLLVIRDVQFEDAGTYTIMAENEIGFDSADINLIVIRHKYPTIKSKIEDLSIGVEEILIVPAEVDGIPKPAVQFLKDGREFQQNDHIQVIENYPIFTLVLKNTCLKDTGVYSVVATNCLAQVSQFWGVYVYSKPKFLHKLGNNLQVDQNKTVVLKAKIQAEPRAVIKWYKNDLQLVANKKILIDDDEGFEFLKIRNTSIQNAGVYRFRAENVHGFVEDRVQIDVKKAPTIVQSFDDAIALEQDVFHIIHSVELEIKIEAFPRPIVTWFLDGDELLDDIPEFTRVETSDSIKLIINEPTTDLSGEYRCRLTNECGQDETSGKVTVNCSPRINVQLNDLNIEEHSTLTLEVIVRGFPAPQFRWFRNNQEMDPDERIQIGLETYGKQKYKIFCTISGISYAERGEYVVQVVNAYGDVKSRCIVNVLTKPIFLQVQMPDTVIKEGEDVTYNVRAFANPPAQVTWLWENTVINSGDKKDWNKLLTSNNNTEFRMGIRRARMVDAGIYQCVLENSVGITKHRAALAVLRRKNEDV
ncbi:unnamed protein product [Ceutorhynchus assimilis]|uniref:Ig-like domain-containing protein n=1 Tax=Ceutorhynchus assimilis TaxID=467358 RepID=A0A9N9QKZ0_9CUCU|nr:unnamed protein product [Ceutorhynchus assimilis]